MTDFYSDYDKSRKYHEHDESIFEEMRGDGLYLMRSASRMEDDDYMDDEFEISNPKNIEYDEVINFNFQSPISVLDLTWMNKDDAFALEYNEQYKYIKEIRVNIDNLSSSKLPFIKEMAEQIVLTVCGNKTQSSIVHQMRVFKEFMDNNASNISGIKLEGFSPIVESLLKQYPKVHNVNVVDKIHNMTCSMTMEEIEKRVASMNLNDAEAFLNIIGRTKHINLDNGDVLSVVQANPERFARIGSRTLDKNHYNKSNAEYYAACIRNAEFLYKEFPLLFEFYDELVNGKNLDSETIKDDDKKL